MIVACRKNGEPGVGQVDQCVVLEPADGGFRVASSTAHQHRVVTLLNRFHTCRTLHNPRVPGWLCTAHARRFNARPHSTPAASQTQDKASSCLSQGQQIARCFSKLFVDLSLRQIVGVVDGRLVCRMHGCCIKRTLITLGNSQLVPRTNSYLCHAVPEGLTITLTVG